MFETQKKIGYHGKSWVFDLLKDSSSYGSNLTFWECSISATHRYIESYESNYRELHQ